MEGCSQTIETKAVREMNASSASRELDVLFRSSEGLVTMQIALNQMIENFRRNPGEDELNVSGYLDALEKAPHLIISESNPSWFLRCENGDSVAACHRLIKYWAARLRIYGPDLAFRSVLNGDALGLDCLHRAKTGTFVVLPNDSNGHSVLCLDMGRSASQLREDDDLVLRTRRIFFVCSQTLSNPMTQEEGLVLVKVVSPKASLNVPDSKGLVGLIVGVFPIKVHRFHVVCSGSAGAKRFFTEQLLPVASRGPGSGFLPDAVNHVATSPVELWMQLEKHGFEKQGIPVSMGGTWDYQEWEDFVDRLSAPLLSRDSGTQAHVEEEDRKPAAVPDLGALAYSTALANTAEQELNDSALGSVSGTSFVPANASEETQITKPGNFSSGYVSEFPLQGQQPPIDRMPTSYLQGGEEHQALTNLTQACANKTQQLQTSSTGLKLPPCGIPEVDQYQGTCSEDSLRRLDAAMEIKPPERFDRGVTKEEREAYIRKRNAVYAKRKYYKKKLKVESLKNTRDKLVAENKALREDNERLENLYKKAQHQVLGFDAQGDLHSSSVASLGGIGGGSAMLGALVRNSGLASGLAGPPALNLSLLGDTLGSDEALHLVGPQDGYSLTVAEQGLQPYSNTIGSVLRGFNRLLSDPGFSDDGNTGPNPGVSLVPGSAVRPLEQLDLCQQDHTNVDKQVQQVDLEAAFQQTRLQSEACPATSITPLADIASLFSGDSGLLAMQAALNEMIIAFQQNPVSAQPDASAYLDAVKRAPQLIAAESNPTWFLRRDDGNPVAASRRLLNFWASRLAIFGPDHAFRSVLNGDALDADSVTFLRRGSLVILPRDVDGRSVAFLDLDRRGVFSPNQGQQLAPRFMFFIFSHLFSNPKTQTEGVVLLRLVPHDGALDMPTTKKFFLLVEKSLPLRIHSRHFLCCSPPRTSRIWQSDVAPHLDRIPASGRLPCTIKHIAESPEGLCQKLEMHGLQKQGLPSTLGGTWDYQEFHSFLDAQLSPSFGQKQHPKAVHRGVVTDSAGLLDHASLPTAVPECPKVPAENHTLPVLLGKPAPENSKRSSWVSGEERKALSGIRVSETPENRKGIKLQSCGLPVVDQCQGTYSEDSLRRLDAAMEIKPPECFDRGATEEERAAYIRKRNAVYAKRKYYKKKLKVEGLENTRDKLLAEKKALREDNERLENLYKSAQHQVLGLGAQGEYNSTSIASLGGAGDPTALDTLFRNSGLAPGVLGPAAVNLSRLGDVLRENEAVHFFTPPGGHSLTQAVMAPCQDEAAAVLPGHNRLLSNPGFTEPDNTGRKSDVSLARGTAAKPLVQHDPCQQDHTDTNQRVQWRDLTAAPQQTSLPTEPCPASSIPTSAGVASLFSGDSGLLVMQASLDEMVNSFKQNPVKAQSDASAYLEAVEKAPNLIATESNPIWFLRREDGNPLAASRRLLNYWTSRLALFGPKLAFRSVMNGDALEADTVAVLRQGGFVVLPHDGDGHSVLFCDLDRCEMRFNHPDRPFATRSLFFIMSQTFSNPKSQTEGVVLLRLLPHSGELEMPSTKKLFLLLEKSLPVRVHSRHILCCSPSCSARLLQGGITAQLDRTAGPGGLSRPIIRHVSDSPDGLCQQLELHGLEKRNLPPALGGNWDYKEFYDFLDAQLSPSVDRDRAADGGVGADANAAGLLNRAGPSIADIESPVCTVADNTIPSVPGVTADADSLLNHADLLAAEMENIHGSVAGGGEERRGSTHTPVSETSERRMGHSSSGIKLPPCGIPVVDQYQGEYSEDSLRRLDAAMEIKPPECFDRGATEEERAAYIRKRNAVYSKRKYYKKKLKIESLENSRDKLVAENKALQEDNERLENLYKIAQREALIFEAQSEQNSTSVASRCLGGGGGSAMLDALLRSSGLMPDVAAPPPLNNFVLGDALRNDGAMHLMVPPNGYSSVMSQHGMLPYPGTTGPVFGAPNPLQPEQGSSAVGTRNRDVPGMLSMESVSGQRTTGEIRRGASELLPQPLGAGNGANEHLARLGLLDEPRQGLPAQSGAEQVPNIFQEARFRRDLVSQMTQELTAGLPAAPSTLTAGTVAGGLRPGTSNHPGQPDQLQHRLDLNSLPNLTAATSSQEQHAASTSQGTQRGLLLSELLAVERIKHELGR